MILKRLLTAKWRKDKSAEKSAPAKPAAQAVEATDPGARRQACKMLTDLELLQRVALQDDDAGVRDLASARLRNLLCGNEAGALDSAQRITRLASLDDQQIINHIALNGKEPELRRCAVQRVQRPQTLAECAMRDKVAAVRLAAVERLDDKAELEQVARKIGKKDKSVYRLARQKIRDISEKEQAPLRLKAKAEALCEQAETLNRRALWMQDKATFDHLIKQWEELGADLPSASVERFTQLQTHFMAAYNAYRAENLARIQEQEALERQRADKRALIEELDQLSKEGEISAIEAALTDIEQRWQALSALPQGEEQALQKAFEQAAEPSRQILAQRRSLQERQKRVAQLLAQAEKWRKLSAPLDQKQLKKWRAQAEKWIAVQSGDALAEDLDKTRQQLQAQLKKQVQHSEQKLNKLPQRLDELEHELEEGILKQATSLHQSIHADLELIGLSGMGRHHYAEHEQRYKQLTPRLRELQKWRKWGADQHRIDLCDAMEKLVDESMPLEQLTEQVQQLQADWKRLDQSGSPVNEPLWKRFHQAADKSYERCRPYLEQQAEIKRANGRARDDLCQQLEDFLAQVDWEDMDWKKAVRAEREMRGAWSEIGPTEPKQRRALDKRFKAALKQLDAQLAQERARNREFKKSLIEQAQQLRELPELEQAIEQIKQLQKQWRTTVPGKRKQENQLWREFREAGDAVFERRREIQQLERNELAEHANTRRALCEQLETLAQTPDASAGDILNGLHKLQGQWEDKRHLPVTRQEDGKLQRRWRNAEEAAQQRVQSLRGAAQQEQSERLFAFARLCEALEAQVETDAFEDEAHWLARWDELTALEDKRQGKKIRQRFDAALSAAKDSAQRQAWLAELPDNQTTRADLCLRLEVLAGIESPPEAAQERLAFQVSRLSERLTQGEQDPLDNAPQVEQVWLLCGPAPAAQMARLNARFERARKALSPENSPQTGESSASAQDADG